MARALPVPQEQVSERDERSHTVGIMENDKHNMSIQVNWRDLFLKIQEA